MRSLAEINKMLSAVPKESLGFYPTPLHKLERLSDQLGVSLYLKRDDMSGVNIFGGNKVRKLEYILGEALAKGCDTVITYGAVQSNHAMQTVSACRRLGLSPVLFLVSVVEPDLNDIKSNLLLDYIYGAEVHIVSIEPGETEADAEKRSFQMGEEYAAKLEKSGKRPYVIPMGGASPAGTVGFIGGYSELAAQMDDLGIPFQYLFHGTGTGGTLAGLAAGRVLTETDTKIISVAVSLKDSEYETRVAELANNALELIGRGRTVTPESLCVDRNFFEPGYEIPNEKGNEAIRRLARTEGILMDTVYTGKAFAGMLEYIESEKVPKGSSVVFLHTGGATALFAEKEIIGGLAQK